MFQSGFLIPGHRSSCFRVGIFFTMVYLFPCECSGQIICQFVNLHFRKWRVGGNTHCGIKKPICSLYLHRYSFLGLTLTQKKWRTLWRMESLKSSRVRQIVCVIDEMDCCSAVWFGQRPGQVPHQRCLACVRHTLSISPQWIQSILASISYTASTQNECVLLWTRRVSTCSLEDHKHQQNTCCIMFSPAKVYHG